MNFPDDPNEKVDEKLAVAETEVIRISLNFVNHPSLKTSIAKPNFPDCSNCPLGKSLSRVPLGHERFHTKTYPS